MSGARTDRHRDDSLGVRTPTVFVHVSKIPPCDLCPSGQPARGEGGTTLGAARPDLEEDARRMPRTRMTNVSAAQWSPNGGAMGQSDLTQAGAYGFGANVFSTAVQRQRLSPIAFK